MYRFVNKLIAVCLISVMMSILLVGCGESDKESYNANEEDAESVKIGMCFDSFVIERWEKDRDVFVSTARDLGAEVNVQNANGEVKEQIAQIDYFIEKDVDAIVIISIDADALKDVIKRAKNKGIKVIAYDRMINNSNVDLYVSFDNIKVGEMMAEAILDNTQDNPAVLLLQGSPTDNNVSQVWEGFNNIASQSDMNIVDTSYAEGWRAEAASDYLYEHPEIINEIDAIMCGNDNLANSVVRVLAEKRKAGKIVVVGQDAELEACQRIVEGTQSMTVYKPVEREAEEAAKATVKLVKGEAINELVTISDGTYDVQGIVLEPIAVSRENLDAEIIDTGFHLKEEVYLNLR